MNIISMWSGTGQPIFTTVIMELSRIYVKKNVVLKSRDEIDVDISKEVANFNNIAIEDDGFIDIFCSKDMTVYYRKVLDSLANVYGENIKKRIIVHCA